MTTSSQQTDAVNPESGPTLWEQTVPWFLTITSTLTLIAIAWYLVENVLFFRSTAFGEDTGGDLVFRMHAHHLHIAMVKRSVGLFSGFALLFLGTGIIFFQTRSRSRYKVTGQVGPQTLGAEIVTASPGIIAITLAVILLLGTIAIKDRFPDYSPMPSYTLGTVGPNGLHVPQLRKNTTQGE